MKKTRLYPERRFATLLSISVCFGEFTSKFLFLASGKTNDEPWLRIKAAEIRWWWIYPQLVKNLMNTAESFYYRKTESDIQIILRHYAAALQTKEHGVTAFGHYHVCMQQGHLINGDLSKLLL